MRSATHYRYGPPSVVEVRQVPVPVPQRGEILIKVVASAVTRTDSGFRSAEYFISRFWSGLFRPKFTPLGCVYAGIVKEVGADVSEFKTGDAVFGFNDHRFGGHAEYCVQPARGAIALAPVQLSLEDSAAIPEGALYALNIIRAANVHSGQRVLVYGATGAIGTAAVQLLAHLGAIVTAVCPAAQVDLVRSLGAGSVIAFDREDFTRCGEKFDFVMDAVGKSSFGVCAPMLADQGVYISTELGRHAENVWKALLHKFFRNGKRILFPIPEFHKEDVIRLAELADAGKLRPVIDRKYPLDDIVAAYEYVETGQKIGNVLLIC